MKEKVKKAVINVVFFAVIGIASVAIILNWTNRHINSERGKGTVEIGINAMNELNGELEQFIEDLYREHPELWEEER